MKISQITPFLFSLTTVTLAQSFCDATGHSGESVTVTSNNKVGKIGNIDYQQWADGGNNSAVFYSDGSFSCAFQKSIDYLCRTGVSFNNGKTPSQIGHIMADFKVIKQDIDNVGYAYIGIYGWTKNPRVEYYVVDDWLSPQRPGDWLGNQKKGDFVIDGAEYTVYKNVRSDLTQYFSLRKTGRSCGTIDVSAHFEKWEELGMTMGTLDEVKVLAEIGNSNGGVSGTVDFPYAKVYLSTGTSSQASTQQQQTSTQTQQAQTQQTPTYQQSQTQQVPTYQQSQTQQAPSYQQVQTQQQAPQQQNNNGWFNFNNFNMQQNPSQQQAPTQSKVPQQQNNWGNNGWGAPKQPAKGQAPQNNWGNAGSNNAVSNNNGSNCAGDWAQCGGINFKGPTCCQKGGCLKINEFYSQCKPYL